MDALYAFMRVTDDISDEASVLASGGCEPPGTSNPPGGSHPPLAKTPAQQLAAWRSGLLAALDGNSTHPIHPALADTVHRFAIPPRFLLDVIDGVEADLEPVRFATFAELYPYCYRVASAVGLACIRIWGLQPGITFADADKPAEAAGIAFQLTNILRDVGEDAARGRVYLPADELTAFGCPPERWRDPACAVFFRDLMRMQVNRAQDFYRQAEPLERLLTAEGRGIFRVMCGTYRALLNEIERRNFDVFTRRVRVPRWRKGLILLSGWATKRGWA